MSPTNGSIANLFVMRKSLDAPDNRMLWPQLRMSLSCSVSERGWEGWRDEDANKKPTLERRRL
jgi:hypothetical protein